MLWTLSSEERQSRTCAAFNRAKSESPKRDPVCSAGLSGRLQTEQSGEEGACTVVVPSVGAWFMRMTMSCASIALPYGFTLSVPLLPTMAHVELAHATPLKMNTHPPPAPWR